jgi:squalene synthase HpnC
MSRAFAAQLRRYGPEGADHPAPTLRQARAYCRRLALTHYENFLVATLAVPAHLRPHFHSIYAFCRWADDLADEIPDPQQSLALLDWWEQQLLACYRGHPVHPVMVALQDTIRTMAIPPDPFERLITAFRQDQCVRRYETFAELSAYCRCSANPVGELVLYVGRCHTPAHLAYADQVCTGLQLANFCQDVAEDRRRGRLYLPAAELRQFGVSEAALACPSAGQAVRALLEFQVARAEQLLREGAPLTHLVPRWLAVDVELFVRGGLAILDTIRQLDFDVLARRPTVSRWRQARLFLAAKFGSSRSEWPVP